MKSEGRMNTLLVKKYENEQKANLAEGRKQTILENLPVRVTLHTNRNCNLTCGFCGFSSKLQSNPDDIMDLDLLERISSQIFPFTTEVIPTTYGEPLIYPHFKELLKLLYKTRNFLSMYTNGILLTKNIVIKFISILNDLKISFDGATKITYEKLRTLSNFDEVIKNITQFQEIRNEIKYIRHPTLTFQFTLMKSNFTELTDFIKLAAKLKVDRVAVSHMYSFHPNKDHELLIHNPESANKHLMNARKFAMKNGIEFFGPRLFSANIDSDFTSIFNKGTCSYLYNETWITASGDVKPCFFTGSPVMGNLNEESFQSIWNGENYQKMRTSVNIDTPLYNRCKICPIKMQFSNSIDKKYDMDGFLLHERGIQEKLTVI